MVCSGLFCGAFAGAIFGVLYYLLARRTRYFARVTAAQLKTAQCEKCATTFHYCLFRSATAGSSRPIAPEHQGVEDFAVREARFRAERQVAREVDLVECPNCRWINISAIRHYRRRCHRIWYFVSGVCLLVGVLAGLCYALVSIASNEHFGVSYVEALFFSLLMLALTLLSLLVQWILRRRINPSNLPENTPVPVPSKELANLPPSAFAVASGPPVIRVETNTQLGDTSPEFLEPPVLPAHLRKYKRTRNATDLSWLARMQSPPSQDSPPN